MSAPLLVDPSWLRSHLGEPDIRPVDVRWYLQGPRTGAAAHAAGHIEGASFLDLDRDLSGPAGAGRHPLPDPAAFVRALARAGLAPAAHIVAYDDAGGSVAARLWWMLRAIGHARVSVLDGGLGAWTDAGYPLTTLPALSSGGTSALVPTAAPEAAGAWHLPEGASPRAWGALDRAEVEALVLGTSAAGSTLLLDARSGERFRGEAEPVDPKAGHIPSAKNAPFADNLDRGRFRSPDELRRHYASLGAGHAARTIVYCGSGVTACHNLLALEIAGIKGTLLYAGGWSDWARQVNLPIETGTGTHPPADSGPRP